MKAAPTTSEASGAEPPKAGSLKAVLTALGGNLGIAAAKSVAAFFTGSGALLAEALHSFADCGNQLLLLVGMKQAQRAPDEDHPMGHGKVAYFWSMMVALLLFSVGGAFSIYHGIHALQHPEPLKYLVPSILVLAASVAMEGYALRGALQAVSAERGSGSLWSWFRATRQSELMVVVGEDVAALGGLAVALLALVLTAITGNPVFDALGTIAVGALLVVVAGVVLFEVKSLITGESASPRLRSEIQAFVEAQPEVERVVNMLTQQYGDYIMVALKVKMRRMESDLALVAAINEIEERMQHRFTNPRLKYSFFEPDLG
ncbi:MAG: cation diffusion facilitator family transporter [Ramlibacter sp.]|nr:cation diffusion facilitator family transporter [Ramlibacter sp.]